MSSTPAKAISTVQMVTSEKLARPYRGTTLVLSDTISQHLVLGTQIQPCDVVSVSYLTAVAQESAERDAGQQC